MIHIPIHNINFWYTVYVKTDNMVNSKLLIKHVSCVDVLQAFFFDFYLMRGCLGWDFKY